MLSPLVLSSFSLTDHGSRLHTRHNHVLNLGGGQEEQEGGNYALIHTSVFGNEVIFYIKTRASTAEQRQRSLVKTHRRSKQGAQIFNQTQDILKKNSTDHFVRSMCLS